MSGGNNVSLNASKKSKKDEYYTKRDDVEQELYRYKNKFRDKIVFLNCDDPEGKKSNFWLHFKLQFEALGLKRLIAIHYEPRGLVDIIDPNFKPPYKLEMYKEHGVIKTKKTGLKGDGNFLGSESIKVLKECDIVVTNPPFSLFRKFMKMLVRYNKDFIVVGPLHAITYAEFFPLIQNGDIWLGYSNIGMEFMIPKQYYDASKKDQRFKDGIYYKKLGYATWYTNIDHEKRHENLVLYKKYSEADYVTYSNFDAIEVDTVTKIPYDYDGIMGVPSSFLSKYNPNQFEILGDERTFNISKGRCYIGDKRKYSRLFIKRK